MSSSISYILTTIGVDSDDPKCSPSSDYLRRISVLLEPLEKHLGQVGMPPAPIVIRIESCNSSTDKDTAHPGNTND